MDRRARARAATWAQFWVTGLVSASWAARIPAVAQRLDLSPGELALVVLGVEGGALLGLPLGGTLVSHLGVRWSVRAGFAVYAPGVLVAALAPGLGPLVAGMTLWAAANSVLDVALNAQGAALDRAYERPVLSSLHAGQGIGLLLGALVATAAASRDVSLLLHLSAVTCVALAVGLLATRAPTVGSTARVGPSLRRPSRRLLVLGLIAFCAFLVDAAAANWVAVHLAADHGAGGGAAAGGYLLVMAAVVVGRLHGDRLVSRLGRAGVVRTGGGLITLGTVLVVLAPGLPLAVTGWVLVGLGLAPMAPTVLGAAARTRAVPAPAAIAMVTTIGYLGSFSGAPLIGAVAETVDLPTALALMAAAGVAAIVLAGRLDAPSPPPARV